MSSEKPISPDPRAPLGRETSASPVPLRITFLITDLKVGGVPLHLYRLARLLAGEGVRVRVVSLADEGPVGVMLRRAGIPVLGCGARSPMDVRALWRLRQILASDPPDILHALLFHANIAARLVAPLAGIPIARVLCEIQTVERERRWHLLVDNVTCRLCRTEIGNSPSVIDHLHRVAYIPSERLGLEWGAVDVPAITQAPAVPRASLGVLADEKLVLWSGRLDPVKGFEQMIPAVARLAAEMPVRFALAGDGAYRPVVERLIREHGLQDRAVLLGERSDVPGLLRAADAFLFCSMTEGLPNAVLEAMAAALPIVATDVPGCRDLIHDGETGVLVPFGDVEATVRSLRRVLCDRDEAASLGAAAREWVTRHATLSRLAPRWLARYGEVMSTAGRHGTHDAGSHTAFPPR